MTVVNVVTSCSSAGWEQYGRACVRSFLTWWPQEARLHVVSEDHLPEVEEWVRHQAPRIVSHDLLDNVDASYFLARHENSRRANGRGFTDGYDFRFDAYRFCKKVFSIDMVTRKHATHGRLIWMDADCVTHTRMPLALIERLPPTGHAVAHFARSNYTECGFIGYDLNHPSAITFIREMARVYTTDEVFREKEWHDSWVWDRVRERMGVPSFAIPTRNGATHPLVYSEIGKYLDHRKGNRKKLSASPEHPIYGSRRRRSTR